MFYKFLVSKFLARFNLKVVTIIFTVIAVFGLVAIGLGVSKLTDKAANTFSFTAIVDGLFAFSIGAQVAYAAYKHERK